MSRPDAKYFDGRLFGISISNSKTLVDDAKGGSKAEMLDLGRLGLLPTDLDRLATDLVSALVFNGARIGYGGDLREGSFTKKLFDEVVVTYALGTLKAGHATFIHYVAFPVWQKWSADQLFAYVAAMNDKGEVRLFLPSGGQFILAGDEDGIDLVSSDRPEAMEHRDCMEAAADLEWLWEDNPRPKTGIAAAIGARLRPKKKPDIGTGLTAMRNAMSEEEDARIIIGGKVDGYTGDAPGIAEEALAALQQGKLLIPIGSYGGCARFVAHALGLLPDDQLLSQKSKGKNFDETMEEIKNCRNEYMNILAAKGIDLDTVKRLSETDTSSQIARIVIEMLQKYHGVR